MFAENFARVIEAARPSQLDDLSKTLWKAHAAAVLTDEEAERYAETIEEKRRTPTTRMPVERTVPRRVGSRPKSAASLERRRRWVAAGMMPPAIACLFTMGEGAVLAVIAAEVGRKTVCSLAVGHIAALAGVSETTVRNAVRRAAAHGLIKVQERRLHRRRNATNLVTIASIEWRTWLRLGDPVTRWRVQKRVGDQYTSILHTFTPFGTQPRRERGQTGIAPCSTQRDKSLK